MIIYKFYGFLYRKVSIKLGFSIPLNVFGAGLCIPHYGTIVVNHKTKVGVCCVLHTCVCIASQNKTVLGNYVYLSKGVTIAGNINIADNVTISANSFVNKSCDEENVLLGGAPAYILKQRQPWYLEDGQIFTEKVQKVKDLLER